MTEFNELEALRDRIKWLENNEKLTDPIHDGGSFKWHWSWCSDCECGANPDYGNSAKEMLDRYK